MEGRASGRASECEPRDAAAAFDGAAAHLDPLWAGRRVRRLRSGAATREKRCQDDGGGDLAVPQGGLDRVGRGVASEGAGRRTWSPWIGRGSEEDQGARARCANTARNRLTTSSPLSSAAADD